MNGEDGINESEYINFLDEINSAVSDIEDLMKQTKTLSEEKSE